MAGLSELWVTGTLTGNAAITITTVADGARIKPLLKLRCRRESVVLT